MRFMTERAVVSALFAATLAAGPALAQVTPATGSRQRQTEKAKTAQEARTRGATASDASERAQEATDNAPRFPQDRWNWTPRSFEEERRFPSQR